MAPNQLVESRKQKYVMYHRINQVNIVFTHILIWHTHYIVLKYWYFAIPCKECKERKGTYKEVDFSF